MKTARRVPAAMALVALAWLLPSCADDGSPTTTNGGTSGATVEDSVPADGSWSTTEATFGASEAEIQLVAAVDGGYLAAGTREGGLAVWSSDDLVEFEQIYAEPCCDRHLRIGAIEQFGDRVLMGATGQSVAANGVRTDRSWLLVSEDGGATWDEIDDPAFTAEDQRLDRLVVTEGAVIAEVVIDDQEGGDGPVSDPWWSTDLVDWSPVELPGAELGDWPGFQGDGTQVWAVAARGQSTVVWSSDDGGRTFEPEEPLARYPDSMAAVGGNLVVWPQAPENETDGALEETYENGPSVLSPGGSWRQEPTDIGQWGEGRLRVWGEVDPTTGRFVAVVIRTPRADLNNCFDDPQTCDVPEIALVTSTDGIEWHDIAGADLAIDTANDQWPLLTGDGSIAVARPDVSGGLVLHGRRWSGPGLPELVDPASPPVPERPVPLYESGPLPVGEERRYELGLGGCGGMYVDGISWVPTEPLPDPLPATWPYRSVDISDGPSGYVYGRIERIAEDRIEFSIEGEGTVATFVPETPDPNQGTCG